MCPLISSCTFQSRGPRIQSSDASATSLSMAVAGRPRAKRAWSQRARIYWAPKERWPTALAMAPAAPHLGAARWTSKVTATWIMTSTRHPSIACTMLASLAALTRGSTGGQLIGTSVRRMTMGQAPVCPDFPIGAKIDIFNWRLHNPSASPARRQHRGSPCALRQTPSPACRTSLVSLTRPSMRTLMRWPPSSAAG
jgi:hypothetical protein